MRRPLRSVFLSASIAAALLAHGADAAPDPCKAACKTAKQSCVEAAKASFAVDKAECAAAPPGAERKSCKQAARAALASAKTACKSDKVACAAACASGMATTTTLPGTHSTCGDAEAVTVRGITNAHDAVRANPSIYSNGMSQPAPDPALAPLCYSTEIAAIAQAWADQCHYMHNAGRGNLGENIYAEAGPGTPSARTPVDAVQLWSAEAEFFDYASNTCAAPDPPGTCLHYTQVVWRDTASIGCGLAVCTANSPFPGFTRWTFVVCDYAPPGNVSVCGAGGCVLQKPY